MGATAPGIVTIRVISHTTLRDHSGVRRRGFARHARFRRGCGLRPKHPVGCTGAAGCVDDIVRGFLRMWPWKLPRSRATGWLHLASLFSGSDGVIRLPTNGEDRSVCTLHLHRGVGHARCLSRAQGTSHIAKFELKRTAGHLVCTHQLRFQLKNSTIDHG